MDGADGLTWDYYGRLFISSWKTGKVFVIARPGEKPVLVGRGVQVRGRHLPRSDRARCILVPDMKGGTLTAIPAQVPGCGGRRVAAAAQDRDRLPRSEVDRLEPARPTTARPNPLRPIVLTHAGDGSNRVFVATQHGVIHVFPNDPKATETKVFLDIQDRVQYDDSTNEEGFLGVAFHPKFKENGEFFVFYTPKRKKPRTRWPTSCRGSG